MSGTFDSFLEAYCGSLEADVQVNGFSILRTVSPKPLALAARIDGFLVAGSNRIRATLRPVPIDPDVDPPPSFELQLLVTRSGDPRAENDRVLFAAFDPEALRIPEDRPFTALDHAFDLPAVRTRYRFLDGQTLDDDRVARDLSVALVRALDARDLKTVRLLYEMRFSELSEAAGIARVDFEEGFLAPITTAMTAKDFRVEAPSPSELEIESRWGGRVLHVRGPGGRPAAIVRGAGEELCLGWSIASIDGKPTIVR